MKIKNLEKRTNPIQNKKLAKSYKKLEYLINALNKKEIPVENLEIINSDIKLVNSFSGAEKELKQLSNKIYSKIIVYVEKELNFVPKYHYLSISVVMGIAFGAASSTIFNYPVIGITVGTILGIVIGNNLDKSAEKNDKQLDIVVRY